MLNRYTVINRIVGSNPIPSANLPIRDILFQVVGVGQNPAECGHSRRVIRTTAPGVSGHCGPFSASLGPPSLTQPNHASFGTDVESSIIQGVGGRPKGTGFGRIPLGRSEPGSNCPVQRVRYSVVSAAQMACQSSLPGRQRRRQDILDHGSEAAWAFLPQAFTCGIYVSLPRTFFRVGVGLRHSSCWRACRAVAAGQGCNRRSRQLRWP